MQRRQFLALSTAATAPLFAQGVASRPSPNNRVTMAVIGTGNQGIGDLKLFLRDERVQVVAVCDVNKETPGYWDGGVPQRAPLSRQLKMEELKPAIEAELKRR